MKGISSRLTYANVVATLALFIALGGASYAAIKLPKNSVGTKQLKQGAVTKAKISASAQKALVGQAGPPGPAGPAGAPGSALGYAYLDKGGNLIASRSKGIAGVSPPCASVEVQCTSAEPPAGISDLCFKLEFTPHVVVATPSYGRFYAPDEATVVNAKIPSRSFSPGTYGGCPVGYEDAEVRAKREDSFTVSGGLFVIFD